MQHRSQIKKRQLLRTLTYKVEFQDTCNYIMLLQREVLIPSAELINEEGVQLIVLID